MPKTDFAQLAEDAPEYDATRQLSPLSQMILFAALSYFQDRVDWSYNDATPTAAQLLTIHDALDAAFFDLENGELILPVATVQELSVSLDPSTYGFSQTSFADLDPTHLTLNFDVSNDNTLLILGFDAQCYHLYGSNYFQLALAVDGTTLRPYAHVQMPSSSAQFLAVNLAIPVMMDAGNYDLTLQGLVGAPIAYLTTQYDNRIHLYAVELT